MRIGHELNWRRSFSKTPYMILDASISKRISILRTLLILSIVLLHGVGTLAPAQLDFSNASEVLRGILIDRVGRFAVPTLTMVSAYLLFATALDLAPMRLYKKKIGTLVVPFLVFNVGYVGIQYAIEYGTGWAPLYALMSRSPEALANAVTGYSAFPLNVPLHFLRDLFVLTLLAPVFGLLIRNAPWLGLGFVCFVFLTNLDGHLVNRNTMAVLFYIGGMAAVDRWNVRRYDGLAVPALVALIAVSAAMVFGRIESNAVLYLVSPPLVWIASSRLVDTRVGRWAVANSEYSFFIFLTHVPALRVMQLAMDKYVPDAPFLLGHLLTVGLVVTSLALVHEAGCRLMPHAFGVMTGGRARPAAMPRRPAAAVPAFVERRRAPRAADAPVYSEAFRKAIVGALQEARLVASDPHDLAHAASLQH